MLISVFKFLGIWDFVIRNLTIEDHSKLCTPTLWDALMGRDVTIKQLGNYADVALLLDTTVRILLEQLRTTEGSTTLPVSDVLANLVDSVREFELNGPKNALQRKSLALKAIREFYPKVGKAEGNLLIEALVNMAKCEVLK